MTTYIPNISNFYFPNYNLVQGYCANTTKKTTKPFLIAHDILFIFCIWTEL